MRISVRQKITRIAHNRITLSLGISGKELVELTGCSPTTALSVIKGIIDNHPGLMVKTAKRWSVTDSRKIPQSWLSGLSISDALSAGKPSEAGILPADIAINRVRFTAHNPVADQAIMMLLRASYFRKAGALHRGAIRIKYVGLRTNEQAKWRTVIPVMLEEFSGKWRIIGIDVEKNEARTFQLSRIIDVEDTLHPIPAKIDAFETYSPKRRISITLSDRLTADQRVATMNELGLDEGRLLQLTEGQLHDMRHQYGIDKPTDNIVWPVIEKAEAI